MIEVPWPKNGLDTDHMTVHSGGPPFFMRSGDYVWARAGLWSTLAAIRRPQPGDLWLGQVGMMCPEDKDGYARRNYVVEVLWIYTTEEMIAVCPDGAKDLTGFCKSTRASEKWATNHISWILSDTIECLHKRPIHTFSQGVIDKWIRPTDYFIRASGKLNPKCTATRYDNFILTPLGKRINWAERQNPNAQEIRCPHCHAWMPTSSMTKTDFPRWLHSPDVRSLEVFLQAPVIRGLGWITPKELDKHLFAEHWLPAGTFALHTRASKLFDKGKSTWPKADLAPSLTKYLDYPRDLADTVVFSCIQTIISIDVFWQCGKCSSFI
ncbi:hypothetical protein CYLTODRAFT_415310 [Cylindrobasidium torrendii FP15055 ss-10]|uniref:Uncharacterized protein n=1 Tax=Cylindrobasidium torrendii FP15055 ss-10 TaxID=1314674 RepID=A0A0D7ATR5_9AGAR|nr:hypothetical protein CYLTODRAFT_415310 [Cylindrobasidium torrendii FP15055 ss-10]